MIWHPHPEASTHYEKTCVCARQSGGEENNEVHNPTNQSARVNKCDTYVDTCGGPMWVTMCRQASIKLDMDGLLGLGLLGLGTLSDSTLRWAVDSMLGRASRLTRGAVIWCRRSCRMLSCRAKPCSIVLRKLCSSCSKGDSSASSSAFLQKDTMAADH